jgi:hypothetical protein
MDHVDISRFERVSVVFEKRADGGLRVSSPDVPGFKLSHSNSALAAADVVPALEIIIGELVGSPVKVRLSGGALPLPDLRSVRTTANYTSKLAA